MPDDNHEGFGPGTFGCHESLHEASILADLLDSFSDNQAIVQNPEWKAMADQAAQLIADLYQKIGAAHLPAIKAEKEIGE